MTLGGGGAEIYDTGIATHPLSNDASNTDAISLVFIITEKCYIQTNNIVNRRF